jgi:hypothetical protein
MEATTTVEAINIVFGIPEWTCDEKFDSEITERYPMGHAWEGQVKGYRNENSISEGLFNLTIPRTEIASVEETCLHSWCPSVTVSFDCDLDKLPGYVKMFQEQLRRFLIRMKP